MIDAILCLVAGIAAASWGLLMAGIGTIIQRCRKAQKQDRQARLDKERDYNGE